MKICVISASKNFYAPKKLLEEGKKAGHDVYLTTWEDIIIDIQKENIYFGDKKNSLDKFDAIIPRSDRYSIKLSNKKIVNRHLDSLFRLLIEYSKKHGVFFLNGDYFSRYQSLDKLSQQYFFAENGLPGIETFFFTNPSKLICQKDIIKYPLVAKTSQGSRGLSVFKLKNISELENFLDKRAVDGQLFLFQKYHTIKHDFRILVVGKKVLGIMKRSSNGTEWKTNISLGGSGERYPKNKKMEVLALSVASKMKFDYLGLDLLEDEQGNFRIIETNSLPQFRGFEKAFPEINVAKELIQLVEIKKQKFLI